MSLDLLRSGEALLATAGELVRIWRSARTQVRPRTFPGLADAVVETTLQRAARAMAGGGGDPQEPYRGAVALARVDPRDREGSAEEIDTEWRLLGEVLRITGDALGFEPAPRAWLGQAVEAGRAGARALAEGRGPRGVLVVGQLSGFEPPRKRRE